MGTCNRPISLNLLRNTLLKKRSPMIEVIERRELMTGGFGFVGGTAFFNAPGNSTPNYLPGATIELFKVGTVAPLSTTVTDAKGAYSFQSLDPGTYNVVELPPVGYAVSGNQIASQIVKAMSLTPGTIQVVIPAVSSTYLNYGGVNPATYQTVTDSVNGVSQVNSIGGLSATLGTTLGGTDLSKAFTTFCLDNTTSLTFEGGEKFAFTPKPITSLSNGKATISADHAGRIAYLYNHYGNASLTNIQSPALQLAMWELLYDTGPAADFTSGNFKVDAAYPPTTPLIVNQVLAQATAYFNESAGKSETAVLLMAKGATSVGYQSMVATGSFDFNNGQVQDTNLHNSSLSGFVYCDDDNNGVKDAAEDAIAGVTVTLTGTEKAGGAPVRLVTTTDAAGAYHFLNLNAGNYTITETQPVGYDQAKNTQGTPGNGHIVGDNIAGITLYAGVNGKNNNFGERGATVGLAKLQLLGIHHQSTTICLKFDGALDPKSAQNIANYTLIALGKDQRLGSSTNHHVKITKAVYDASEHTVILTPATHLNIHYHYLLQTKLNPAQVCSPPINTVNVFGRAAVPTFTIHGVTKAAPPMLGWEIQRDRAVVTNALAAYARNSNMVLHVDARHSPK